MSAEPPWHRVRAAEFRAAADLCDDLAQTLANLDDWQMPRRLRRKLRRLRRALGSYRP